MPAKMTHKEFVTCALANPSVKKVIGSYNGQHNGANKLIVVCPKGHVSEPMNSEFILRRVGCRECYLPKKTTASFNAELKTLKKPFKIIGEYEGDGTHVRTRCLTCSHEWKQTPNVLLKQKTCPLCAHVARRNMPHKVPFAERLVQIASANPHLLVLSEPYRVGRRNLVSVQCKYCGANNEKKLDVIVRLAQKCPCKMGVNSGRGYSNVAIAWLDDLARKNRVVIEHALNRGEFRIPGTRMSVDGFHRRSNTVFEFLGDYWHKSKQSHQKAVGRLKRIKSLGYSVIYIWESEFKQGLSAKEL